MRDIHLNDISTDTLSIPLLIEKEVEVAVLRLDKIHTVISGNKWFKLRYYLEEAKKQGKKSIVTFGGAWSNHLLATAAACKLNDLSSVGIIRGKGFTVLSPSLVQAKELGMQLFFISREDYRNKHIPDKLNSSENYFISEGGYGVKGAQGAATIADHYQKENYTHTCCATGTGTMLAGLIQVTNSSNIVTGISVLKNNLELEKKVRSLLSDPDMNFHINHDYHFGGYAKCKPALIDFMNEFYRQTNIPSDFVYTGKLFFSIMDLISNNHFAKGSKLLIIHSGGLQGNASLSKGTLIF
jgi:1-aminocyclopropane-1-carboxylate deaminase